MAASKPSSLVDTRVIYCGDNLDQLQKLPAQCVDLIYIDAARPPTHLHYSLPPPRLFNSNRNYEVFWGETKEKRSFEDRHESTKAYIDYMRPRGIKLGFPLPSFLGVEPPQSESHCQHRRDNRDQQA